MLDHFADWEQYIRKIDIYLNYLNGLILLKNNFKINKGNKENIFP